MLQICDRPVAIFELLNMCIVTIVFLQVFAGRFLQVLLCAILLLESTKPCSFCKEIQHTEIVVCMRSYASEMKQKCLVFY